MARATLVGRLNTPEGQYEVCNKMSVDERGVYIVLSFTPEGDKPEDHQDVVRPGEVKDWADEHPLFFEVLCIAGLEVNPTPELVRYRDSDKEAYDQAFSDFSDEFFKVSQELGLWFNGLGIMFVTSESIEEAKIEEPSRRPSLLKRLFGQTG